MPDPSASAHRSHPARAPSRYADQQAPVPKPVRITKVSYDPAGPDTGTNAHLNREWVTIKNFGQRIRQLRDWTLRDTSGHVFHFPTLPAPPEHHRRRAHGRRAANPTRPVLGHGQLRLEQHRRPRHPPQRRRPAQRPLPLGRRHQELLTKPRDNARRPRAPGTHLRSGPPALSPPRTGPHPIARHRAAARVHLGATADVGCMPRLLMGFGWRAAGSPDTRTA